RHTRSKRDWSSDVCSSDLLHRHLDAGVGVLITNLPADACVEVPCLVDARGVQHTVIGDPPSQLAALNRTNVNVQTLAVRAALDEIGRASCRDRAGVSGGLG